MTNDATDSDSGQRTIGPVAYVVAVTSIFPVVGLITGVIAIVWGLSARKYGGTPVALIGAAGTVAQWMVFGFLLHALS